jgi:hypothetical protein
MYDEDGTREVAFTEVVGCGVGVTEDVALTRGIVGEKVALRRICIIGASKTPTVDFRILERNRVLDNELALCRKEDETDVNAKEETGALP